MTKISELRPFMKRLELTAKALKKNEVREVTSKLDNNTHKVTEALIGDDSGTVLLTLWDAAIDNVELGKTYKIANAYTSLFKSSLRLNIGRYGTLEESNEDIADVKEDNNLSEKEFDLRRRSFTQEKPEEVKEETKQEPEEQRETEEQEQRETEEKEQRETEEKETEEETKQEPEAEEKPVEEKEETKEKPEEVKEKPKKEKKAETKEKKEKKPKKKEKEIIQ